MINNYDIIFVLNGKELLRYDFENTNGLYEKIIEFKIKNIKVEA